MDDLLKAMLSPPPKNATESLARMRAASTAFYTAAVQTGCHAFIEFTGLMNEFIKVCHRAEEMGIDWRGANTHSGVPLPIEDYEIHYMAEKLDCIYGPSLSTMTKKIRGATSTHTAATPESHDAPACTPPTSRRGRSKRARGPS